VSGVPRKRRMARMSERGESREVVGENIMNHITHAERERLRSAAIRRMPYRDVEDFVGNGDAVVAQLVAEFGVSRDRARSAVTSARCYWNHPTRAGERPLARADDLSAEKSEKKAAP
jgi:hypothetical protein